MAIDITNVADGADAFKDAVVDADISPPAGAVTVPSSSVPVAADADLVIDKVEGLLVLVPALHRGGTASWVNSTRTETVVWTGAWPLAVPTEVAHVRSGTSIRAIAGDLNGDGAPDLVLSGWADHLVNVFFGPFVGVAQTEEQAFTLRRTVGGLMDLFGHTTLVADLTGDAKPDLLVTAPSEGEEACSGVRPSLVYRGPLSPGRASSWDGTSEAELTPEDDVGPRAAHILKRPSGVGPECLGLEAALDTTRQPNRLLLTTDRDVVAYPLPLSGATPDGTAGADPATFGHETQGLEGSRALRDAGLNFDIDSDGLADVLGPDPERPHRWGWTRSSDGAVVYFSCPDGNPAPVWLDFDRDGLSQPYLGVSRFMPNASYEVTLYLPPPGASGDVELTDAMRVASWTRAMGEPVAPLSYADIDGDGRLDFAYGDVLIRRPLR